MNEHTIQSTIVSGLAIMLLAFSFGRMAALHFPLAPAVSDTEAQETVVFENPFSAVDMKAKAAIVFDIKTGTPLFVLNENVQLPLASLTKIMTALVAVEERGEDGVATMSKEAIMEEGDHGFIVGEKWRLKDLIDATLVTSSNDGARALASVSFATLTGDGSLGGGAFKQVMNEKARQLGLTQTFFIDEAGLDVSFSTSGAYGSALDVARLLSYALIKHPTLMEATSRLLLTNHSLDGKAHNFENTNKSVETFPGVIASKTGFTDLAGGNLALIFEAGPMRPIAVVVLGSTAEERFTDAEQLISASLEYIKQ